MALHGECLRKRKRHKHDKEHPIRNVDFLFALSLPLALDFILFCNCLTKLKQNCWCLFVLFFVLFTKFTMASFDCTSRSFWKCTKPTNKKSCTKSQNVSLACVCAVHSSFSRSFSCYLFSFVIECFAVNRQLFRAIRQCSILFMSFFIANKPSDGMNATQHKRNAFGKKVQMNGKNAKERKIKCTKKETKLCV